jgi:hypothetical protein
MEPISPQGVRRSLVLAGAFLLLSAGCVSTDPVAEVPEKPPIGTPCQLVATWSKDIAVTPDPANRGQPTPGLTGRLYLFGPELGHPMLGDGGSVVIDLFDDRPTGEGKAPVLLEEWRIDKDTLKRLARRDTVGWGYTLFLPWGTYKPDITQIHMRVRYEPPQGMPLYLESSSMALAQPGGSPTAIPGPAVAQKKTKARG